MSFKEDRPNIHFVAYWDKQNPRGTWSGTSHQLRMALKQLAYLTDTDVSLSLSLQRLYKLLNARVFEGGLVSSHTYSPNFLKAVANKFLTKQNSVKADAILATDTYGVHNSIPTWFYRDMDAGAVLQARRELGFAPKPYGAFPTSMLEKTADWQMKQYESSQGIFCMSDWLRAILIERGIPPHKLVTVHAGADVRPAAIRHRSVSERPEILLVGREFYMKGADSVVQAVDILAREWRKDIRLTIAGPRQWEMKEPPSDNVRFLGPVPQAQVAQLYNEATVFCMPSRFDGFGKVFVEALATGLPTIGRSILAMPEFIEDGKNGALLPQESENEALVLAELLQKTLTSQDIFDYTFESAHTVAQRFSWEQVATSMVRSMTNTA